MKITCLNCNDQFEGHYCNNCGQPAKTGRLSLHSVWHEIEHALIHLDKGVLYTIKQLFTRPGHSIREFIEGKRVRHFKPLQLVIVITTIQAILFHYFKVEIIPENTYATAKNQDIINSIQQVSDWFTAHFSVTTLIFMFFGTIATCIVFRKRGYNFVEYLFMHAFITSQHMLVQLALFPINYLAYNTPAYPVFSFSISVINMALSMWVFLQFFHKESKVKVFFLTLLSYLLALLLLVATAIAAAVIINSFVKS